MLGGNGAPTDTAGSMYVVALGTPLGPACKAGSDGSVPADGSSDAGPDVSPGLQPMAIDLANPHYFTGLDGQPILFHTHGSNTLNLDGYKDAHWKWYLDNGATQGLNLVKLRGFAIGDNEDIPNWFVSPYKRVSGSGTTTFGNDKMDLDQLNPIFFSHMSEIAAYARDRGVYVQVQIWDHLTLKAGAHPWNWDGSGLNPDNTVTNTAGYGFPPTGGDGASVFYGSLTNTATVGGLTLLDRQNQVFDAIVDATKDYPNVFYELGTEITTSNTAWAKHWVDRLHAIAPGKLIIVDTGHYSGDRSFFDGYTVHQVSSSDDSVPAALYALGKTGIEDTDFTCGWSGTDDGMARQAAWIAVVSGVGWDDFRCSDNLLTGLGTQSSSWVHPGVVSQIATLAAFFDQRQVPFDLMHPMKSIASGAVAVLGGAGQYVIYSIGSNLRVTLPTGSYQAEWYDPRTGVFSPAGTSSGGTRSYTLPTASDWVLYIH